MEQYDWHALPEKEVLIKLKTDNHGLDSKKSTSRLDKYGLNRLKKTRKFHALKIFLDQFKSFLIIVLIFAAVVSFFMESKIDAIVIMSIILLNSILGFYQEYRAERAIDELRKMMVPKATVLRNGKVVEINSEKLVPGDIIILNEGDRIMADARIITSDGIKINEAALTGESVSIAKFTHRLQATIPLGDRKNMVFQGTEVVSGSAKAVVVSTGMNTELGKISGLVQQIKSEKEPFRDKLDSFARKIGIFILILCSLMVLLLTYQNVEILQSFMVAVSLAVSAIPEGLPAVISLGFAFATKRMIKKNVLIRKLPASETLGRTTVICTDKTGTLTEEKMKVSRIYVNGKFNSKKGKDVLLKIGVLCNKATSEQDDSGKKYFIGDPTEIALIVNAENSFLNKKLLEKREPKVKEFPFDSNRKMMSVIREYDRKLTSYVKGAPEKILEGCDYELINNRKVRLTDNRRKKIYAAYEKMANQGLRVLGFAYRDFPRYAFRKINQHTAEEKLVFVGFQGMIDPPRYEVKNSIRLCKKAGIKVLMITGDSELTANAVAKEIGLKGKSINSNELQKMNDDELMKVIDKVSVFSRISPQDKLRIIEILKKKNEIVAMTGDGINDALALKRADIGIAMGIRGTDVARDSSDIVLIDDNFASIVSGVKEGRRIYDNVKKFVKYLLAANFYEVFFVLTIMLIYRNPEFLPLLPLQILWINLVTDSFPALALSSEEMDEKVMSRKPDKGDILKGITGFLLFSGIVGLIIISIAFYLNIDIIDKARTIAVTTSIFYQMLLVFNCKSDKFVFKSPKNKFIWYAVIFSFALHLLVLYTPLNTLFSFTSLILTDWILVISLGIFGFISVEAYKYIERLRK